jgi:hypothetical protein
VPKRSESPKQPQTSKLPIKTDDSPLVIDLPDGQKIVLGKLPNGAVVEVATWRGTGRPDSRTNRIMLGMSNGVAENIAPNEPAPDGKKKSNWITFLKFPKALGSVKKRFQKFLPSRPVEETVDIDIDAWISRLSAQTKARKNDPSSGTSNSTRLKVKPRKPSAKKSVATKKRAKKRNQSKR